MRTAESLPESTHGAGEEPPRVPDPPPGLDLRSLHIEVSAGLLRDWAAETMAELFDERREGRPPGPGRLAELKLRTWRWRPSAAPRLETWVLAPIRLRPEKPRLVHPISLLLARYLKITGSWWWRGLPRRLVDAIELVEPHWPPSLWPVIGTLAWLEPRFQKETAARVWEHFRRSRLMTGREPAIPVFRVQVWWLVVELVGVPALGRPPEKGIYRILRGLLGETLAKTLWRSWYRRTGRGRLRTRLSEIARGEIFSTESWAGFWEQWLVGEVLLRCPELAAEASPESRQLLSALPFLGEHPYYEVRSRVAPATSKTALRELVAFVDPRWEEQRPGWLSQEPSETGSQRTGSPTAISPPSTTSP